MLSIGTQNKNTNHEASFPQEHKYKYKFLNVLLDFFFSMQAYQEEGAKCNFMKRIRV